MLTAWHSDGYVRSLLSLLALLCHRVTSSLLLFLTPKQHLISDLALPAGMKINLSTRCTHLISQVHSRSENFLQLIIYRRSKAALAGL